MEPGAQRGVGERRDVARAAGGALDHVHIGDLQRVQLLHRMLEQRLRVGITEIAGGRDRRQATACTTSTSRRVRAP